MVGTVGVAKGGCGCASLVVEGCGCTTVVVEVVVVVGTGPPPDNSHESQRLVARLTVTG